MVTCATRLRPFLLCAYLIFRWHAQEANGGRKFVLCTRCATGTAAHCPGQPSLGVLSHIATRGPYASLEPFFLPFSPGSSGTWLRLGRVSLLHQRHCLPPGSHPARPGPLVPLPKGYWRGPALSPCPRERERVRHPEHPKLICYILPTPVPTHIGKGLDPGGAGTWTRAT